MSSMIDGRNIPKFKELLPIPKMFSPTVLKNPNTGEVMANYYCVNMSEFKQQILPKGFPKTTVWGYGGDVIDSITGEKSYDYRSYPGPTFENTRGIPTYVKWKNNITGPNPLAVDPTLHWADPNNIGKIPPQILPPFPPGLKSAQFPVPLVTHLHGGETCSVFDGHPDAWFTFNEKKIGPNFATSLYQYTNAQPSTMLWYHDHTLGLTRINVYMGLAGGYFIRDKNNPLDIPGYLLPPKEYEIPLIIQDHSFCEDGSFYFPSVGDNPEVHPYWQPEFFGNTIEVNGKTWPKLYVKRGVYRLRMLNGCNSRFLNLKFSNAMNFIQIGSEGGYLPEPVYLSSVLLGPAERADILIDFSSIEPGTNIILQNDAPTTHPSGKPPDPLTTGQVMKFIVKDEKYPFKIRLPKKLNHIPKLIPNVPKRVVTLIRIRGENGPEAFLLDGEKWSSPITEIALVGSTELWEIVNLTLDTHPIHLHLVQFLVKDRQNFDEDKYLDDWTRLNGMPPFYKPIRILEPASYLKGESILPELNERGWKDTVKAFPNQVTRILVRYAPLDAEEWKVKPGVNLYPFNPQVGPGYVWHCHMLDHEDNEMMRPLIVVDKLSCSCMDSH